MRKLTILLLLLAPSAHAGYRFRYKVTVDHTQAGSSNTANFPILVNISKSDFATSANGGYIQNTVSLNGQTVPADLIVTTDTACQTLVTAWEIASYTASSGTVELWVNQGTLSHTVDTVFYVCIDNPSVSTYQSTYTSVWNSGVWNGVWHQANGSTISGKDSTANANNSTTLTATATSGLVDGAGNYSGSSQEIDTNTNFQNQSTGTVSAWINTSAAGSSYRGIAVQNGAFGLFLKDNLFMAYNWNGGVSGGDVSTGVNVADSTWHYVAISFQSGVTSGTIFYNNGSPVLTSKITINAGLGNKFAVGNNYGASQSYSGKIDEVRVASVVLSADQILADYNQTKPSQTMVTLGSRVALTTGLPMVQ
jgi:hypothetical protein